MSVVCDNVQHIDLPMLTGPLVDHRLRPAMGSGGMSLIWPVWNEGLFPRSTNASVAQPIDIAKRRTPQLCPKVAHPQIGMYISLASPGDSCLTCILDQHDAYRKSFIRIYRL